MRILACLALLALVNPVDACSTKGVAPTLEEKLLTASEVFVAHLVSVTEKKTPTSWGESENPPMMIEARYSLSEVLKGRPPQSGKLYDLVYGIGNCSIGLMAGWDYVVFVQPIEGGPKIRYVGMLSGTFPLQ